MTPLLAALCSWLACGACIHLARRVGAVALVQEDRWHVGGPVPRLAGPGLLVAVLPWIGWQPGLALALFCAVGALDDVRPLRPATKGALLAAASLGAAALAGDLRLAVPLFVVSNAVNLLDHADGLAAASGAATLALAGGSLGAAGAGACLGFLVHGLTPARLFLGDSGSLMLGAAMVLAWWTPTGWIAPLVAAAVPLGDATFVTVRRLWRGTPPWRGGTDHTGHALLRMGLAPRSATLVYAGLAAGAGLVAQRWS